MVSAALQTASNTVFPFHSSSSKQVALQPKHGSSYVAPPFAIFLSTIHPDSPHHCHSYILDSQWLVDGQDQYCAPFTAPENGTTLFS